MKALFGPPLSPDANLRRIRMLFGRLPSNVVAALIGVLLAFLVLFNLVAIDLLKTWAVYMVSVLAGRIWIWYMFTKADVLPESANRWEWLFAAGALLTGLGWGALFGPLFPPQPNYEARVMIILLVLVITFSGAVFVSSSTLTFWVFALSALTPAFIFLLTLVGQKLLWPLPATACCLIVLFLLQRAIHVADRENLERGTQAEILLAEQHAIFDSSPLGIAMLHDKRIVKCNIRFAELLGRRIQDLTGSTLLQQFQSPGEGERFHSESRAAFDKGRVAQGMYRLRRADGTQFWAELSGRRMAGGQDHSVWMVADVTLRIANERRIKPRQADEAPPPLIL